MPIPEETKINELIRQETIGTCEECGTENVDLRPYGEGGKWICFDCGMKDDVSQRRAEDAFRVELAKSGKMFNPRLNNLMGIK